MTAKPLILVFLTIFLGFTFPVYAVNKNNQLPPTQHLEEIKKTIDEVQSNLKQKQAVQKNTQQKLQQTRDALSKAKNELSRINLQQQQAWHTLQKLQVDFNRLKIEINGSKAQLARLLNGHYKNRQHNAVMLFLKNAEPSRKTRYLQYVRRLNQANQKVIHTLTQQQQQLNEQEAAIDAQLSQLDKLKSQKKALMTKLSQEHLAVKTENNKIANQIEQQTKQLSTLRSDEHRLNQLLEDLAKRNAEKRRKEAEARKKAAEARIAAAKAAKEAQKKQKSQKSNKAIQSTETKQQKTIVQSTLTDEDRALQPTQEIIEKHSGFSTMQGRLQRPVNGIIKGRFGQTREDGGTWRGVFFATTPSTIKSIADGTVIYTGPLSGYGNIIVIDHNDDYISVYSGLNSISVASGNHVVAGKQIGISGGLPSGEQGLYLEIRYHSQPMNPLSWLH